MIEISHPFTFMVTVFTPVGCHHGDSQDHALVSWRSIQAFRCNKMRFTSTQARHGALSYTCMQFLSLVFLKAPGSVRLIKPLNALQCFLQCALIHGPQLALAPARSSLARGFFQRGRLQGHCLRCYCCAPFQLE